jgi:hypothetical protein
VTRAGFKPTTACLEGRSSIQLSYRVNNFTTANRSGEPAKIAAKIIKIRQEAKLPRIPGFTYLRPAIPSQPATAAGKPTTAYLWTSKSKKVGNKR